jgi:hypothetical protein
MVDHLGRVAWAGGTTQDRRQRHSRCGPVRVEAADPDGADGDQLFQHFDEGSDFATPQCH